MIKEKIGLVEEIFNLAKNGELRFDIAEKCLISVLPDIEQRGIGTLVVDPSINDILFLEYSNGLGVRPTHRHLENDPDRLQAEKRALELFWNAERHQDFISRGNGLQLVFAKINSGLGIN